MRSMLDNLRDDLGIPAHDEYRENPEDVGMGSSRPAVRSKTKTTGYAGDLTQFKNAKIGGFGGEFRNGGDILYDDQHYPGVQGNQTKCANPWSDLCTSLVSARK